MWLLKVTALNKSKSSQLWKQWAIFVLLIKHTMNIGMVKYVISAVFLRHSLEHANHLSLNEI